MRGLRLALGLSRSVSGAAAPAWDPTSLTNRQFWLEADTAKLWKDTAGTQAVTADGDAVQRIDNKVAGGAFFTILTGTCTYRTNSGKPKLVFVACAFRLSGSAVVVTDGSGQHFSGASVSFSSNTGVQSVWDADNSATIRLSKKFRNNAGVAETIAFNTVPTAFTDTGASLTAGTPATLIEVTTTSATEMFVDNASGGSTAVTGTLQSAAIIPALGGTNYVSVSQLFTGDFYSLVSGTGVINSTERGNFHTYLAGKHP